MKKNTASVSAPLVNLDQLKSSIDYFATREKTFQEKADSERTQLRDCVVRAVQLGMTESEAARLAGVTRVTVRSWCGK